MSNNKCNDFSLIRWAFIAVFLFITVVIAFSKSATAVQIFPVVYVLALFIAVWLHGTVRYGTKNLLIFFIITWLTSHFFEALSIRTGFPFGHYYYDKLIGPRLFQVPLIIIFAYFGTAYASWILSHIFLGQYSKRLSGKYLFLIPFIASFIMVIWDVCMDPLSSTVGSLWVWKDGGPYFGVPLQNYFGWFFVVFLFYQFFALYISKFDEIEPIKKTIVESKLFWMEMVAIYGIEGFSQVVDYFGATSNLYIYASMALLSFFTMIFLSLLAYLKIKESNS